MTLLPQIRDQLDAAAHRRAQQRRRRRLRPGGGRVRRGLRALPVLAGVLAAVVIGGAAIALLRHSRTPPPTTPGTTSLTSGLPPVPQLGPADRQALNAFSDAQVSFFAQHRSCLPRRGRGLPGDRPEKPDYGTPSRALLSGFSVLERPGRTQIAVPSLMVRLLGRPFVHYIRVAQRRFGSVFELVPVSGAAPEPSARCAKLESAAVHATLAHAPARIRARALQIAHEEIRDAQYIREHPESLCVLGGGGSCEPALYALARGGLQSAGSSNSPTLFVYLVPTGVATITARFPPEGPATGFKRHRRALTVTVPVINNLAIWKLANEPGDIWPTIIWHAKDGHVIQTVATGF